MKLYFFPEPIKKFHEFTESWATSTHEKVDVMDVNNFKMSRTKEKIHMKWGVGGGWAVNAFKDGVIRPAVVVQCRINRGETTKSSSFVAFVIVGG